MSGRHTKDELVNALEHHDSVVIMKAGRSRQKIIDALTLANRIADAKYLAYIGREGEVVERDISKLIEAKEEAGPYFSLFVVTRSQRGGR